MSEPAETNAINVACPHCGCEFPFHVPGDPAKPAKPRSVKQHRRQFAVFRAAFMHWPETHHFQPVNEEHLRKYLIAKAPRYRSVTCIDTDGMSPEMIAGSIASALKEAGPWSFHSAVGTRLYVIVPHSIAFEELPHADACDLFNAIAEVIYAEIGIAVETLINETARAA